MVENEKYDILSLLKSSFGVGVVTILGYVLAFLYEKGYTSYFKIPPELIKIDLINILRFIFYLLALIFILYGILNACYVFVCSLSSIIQRIILRSAPYFIYFIVGLLISLNTKAWNTYKWSVALVFVIFLFDGFILPLITQRGKGTYYQKLAYQEEKRNKLNIKEPNLLDKIIPPKNILTANKVINVIIILVIILTVSNVIGNAEAERQIEFLVLKNPSNIVVLKIYGDKYICAPFDPNTKTVEKSLYIIDSKKQDGFWFDWKNVGPLKPKK